MGSRSVIRQPDCTGAFIQETAAILIAAYNLEEGNAWIGKWAQEPEMTLQDMMENWVRSYVRRVTPDMAEQQFQLLLLEFERLYFREEEGAWHP